MALLNIKLKRWKSSLNINWRYLTTIVDAIDTNLNNQMIFIKEIKIIHAFSMKKKLIKIHKSMINKLFRCGLRQVIFQAEIKSLVTWLFILIIPWQKSKEDPCLNLKPKFIRLLILVAYNINPFMPLQTFIQALLPTAAFRQRLSFFTVYLNNYLYEVLPWWAPKWKFLK